VSTLHAVNDLPDKSAEVLENAEERAGAAYIRERLREEQDLYNASHNGRGFQAHVRRELAAKAKHKVTSPTISNIINGNVQAGLRQQRAFARLWEMSLDELQARGQTLSGSGESGLVLSSDLSSLEGHLVAALSLVRKMKGEDDATDDVHSGIARLQEPSATARKKSAEED
jgi:hypothetical protein